MFARALLGFNIASSFCNRALLRFVFARALLRFMFVRAPSPFVVGSGAARV